MTHNSLWPWLILAAVWLVSAYQAWHAYRRLRMAEPENPILAFGGRVRTALGFAVALGMLLLGALASLTIASAERNRPASWAAGVTSIIAVVGGVVLWKWFWKRRRPAKDIDLR